MENQKKIVLVKRLTVKNRVAYVIKNTCFFKTYGRIQLERHEFLTAVSDAGKYAPMDLPR